MLFMVIERFKDNDMVPIYQRLEERGRQLPEGLRFVDSWIEVSLTEGRNRQVRRMTAAAGLPTLRLIRCAVGPLALDGLAPGESREMSNQDAWRDIS